MSEPRVLSRPLGASRLAAAAMDGALDASWFPPAPADATAWTAHAGSRRTAFASQDWHAALAPAFSASGVAAERLARSAGGRGIVVTTGQQPGLFGGPMYTWSKALSTLALADALERATKMPVAPVFWAATYDSDLAEASVTYVARDGDVERLAMAPPDVTDHRMYDTPLGDVRLLAAMLDRASGAAVDRAVLDAVRKAYDPSHTIGSAFVALLRGVLEPLGIAVLDAGHPAVTAAGRPCASAALAAAPAIDVALRAREGELRAAGFEPKVPLVKGLSLVFAVRDGVRRRIPISEAASASGDLEANVLLRPIVEQAILPTAAYVAGPGEIAYFTQVSAVARALKSPPVISVPRWAGMIIEPHVARILARHALSPDDLHDPHATDSRLARRQMPTAVEAALANYRASLDSANMALAEAVHGERTPLTPDPVLEGARRSIAHRLDRLERRLVAAVKHRERDLMHDLAVARASLFPLGHAQERELNFIPFLARHGAPLVSAMRDAAEVHATALVAPRAAPANRT